MAKKIVVRKFLVQGKGMVERKVEINVPDKEIQEAPIQSEDLEVELSDEEIERNLFGKIAGMNAKQLIAEIGTGSLNDYLEGFLFKEERKTVIKALQDQLESIQPEL